ncbi:MAG: transcription antitermination factor NusB [Verrucomicrobia bacterium]|nr:transcription antitermination factor NusB [Verrucomicrobiota bacterium]OQW97399.1 MAG: transcription antitermination factor NusB [Verrucomicrobia bacterium A1]
MSARHESRLLAVQFLFQRDFNDGDLADALADFWAARNIGPKLRAFAEDLIRGVEAVRPELDERLRALATNWDLSRMAAVDRNILRLALYEMHHRADIPPVVSMNEAIDLAKEFGGRESGRFVNGILDRAAKDVKRPARCAAPDPRLLAGGGE